MSWRPRWRTRAVRENQWPWVAPVGPQATGGEHRGMQPRTSASAAVLGSAVQQPRQRVLDNEPRC